MPKTITDYSIPFYTECMDTCLGCVSDKCYGEIYCARLRDKFIRKIEAANGKAVIINGIPAYTLDNGRTVYIGKTCHGGESRDKSITTANGYYTDTGEHVIIVTDGLYFAAARHRTSAMTWLKDEISLNPRKAITLAANM